MADSTGRAGLRVDFGTGVLRRNRVLTQSAPGALLFLGFGTEARRLCRFAVGDDGSDPDPFLARCRHVATAVESGALAKAQRSDVSRALLDIEDRALRRLAIVELLAKGGFDPNEPRDERGRWTSAGDSAAAAGSAAGAIAPRVADSARPLFGDLGPELLAGLAEIGARFSAPAAFLSTLFIPTNRAPVQDGTLPSRPDVSYHYDLDTGTLSLSRDGETFYAGHADADGVFRDENGNALGRKLDGSLVLDPDALPAYEARATGRGQSRAKPRALSQADADRNEPELCPDKVPDLGRSAAARSAADPSEFSDRAAAYQSYVSKLPEGWAVRLLNPKTGRYVYFDGCDPKTGAMLEAKGMAYASMFAKGHPFVLGTMFKQARDQTQAAGGRRIEWHFAEKLPAEKMRDFFSEEYPDITVLYDPPTWDLK